MIRLKSLLSEQHKSKTETTVTPESNQQQLEKFLTTYGFKPDSSLLGRWRKQITIKKPYDYMYVEINNGIDDHYSKDRGFELYTVILLLHNPSSTVLRMYDYKNDQDTGRLSNVAYGWYEIDQEQRNSRKYYIDDTTKFDSTPAAIELKKLFLSPAGNILNIINSPNIY